MADHTFVMMIKIKLINHIYISYILKIIDYNFILDYYVNKKDNVIKISIKSLYKIKII